MRNEKSRNWSLVGSRDTFDSFDFFNIDTFDPGRFSPENSASYASHVLARALPLFRP